MLPWYKKLFSIALIISFIDVSCVGDQLQSPPNGFVDIATAIPNIQISPRYAGYDNFVGQPVEGYGALKVIVSKEVSIALKAVQQELIPQGMSLKIYDGYRPQRAVDHFMAWVEDAKDQKNKVKYYPNVNKADLVKLGYIASKSGHSRGGSVDVSIVQVTHGVWYDLDMGSSWDLFDEKSHSVSSSITKTAYDNRRFLAKLMIKHGFQLYAEEWWHFTLVNEPYPNTYFDFPIK